MFSQMSADDVLKIGDYLPFITFWSLQGKINETELIEKFGNLSNDLMVLIL
jgi:hypothetical protein